MHAALAGQFVGLEITSGLSPFGAVLFLNRPSTTYRHGRRAGRDAARWRGKCLIQLGDAPIPSKQ